MTVVIDRLTAVTTTQFLGEAPNTPYYAQTFKAGGYQLDSVEFLIDTATGPDDTEYKVLIATTSFDGAELHPGTVLFESELMSEPFDVDHTLHHVTVDTGNVALTPGQTYIFILDAFDPADGVGSGAKVGVSYSNGSLGTDYPDGYFAFVNASSGDRSSHFAADWKESVTNDLAFRMTFNVQGVTIVGTKQKDKFDASHTPDGQSFPTGDDDSVFGKGNKDKVFGLAGNDLLNGGGGDDTLDGGLGEDVLSGGKGKDRLFGQAGADGFRFDASLKQPPDKIIDFVADDDTILLSRRVFKALSEGPLPATAFNAGGKKDGDDRILYRDGKVSYDGDGKGGDDPVLVAKVVGNPSLTSDHFVVVA